MATSFKQSSAKTTAKGPAAPAKPATPPKTTPSTPAPKPPAVQAPAKLPAALASRMKQAAADASGFESMAAKDYAIPFLKMVDKSSKIAVEGHSEYIEGCRPGMIFNTVTKRLYGADEGIHVIPCGFKSVILEWESTEPNSGFIAEHPASSDIKDGAELEELENGRKVLVLPNGHSLVDANNYYVLVVDPETKEIERAIISMTSTGLKASRQWNSMMDGIRLDDGAGGRFRPPIYGVQYHMTTKKEQKDDYVYSIWQIQPDDPIQDDALFTAAEDFYDSFSKGLAKGNYAAAQRAGGLDDSGSDDGSRGDDTPM